MAKKIAYAKAEKLETKAQKAKEMKSALKKKATKKKK